MSASDFEDGLPFGFIDAHHHVWAPDSRGDEIGYGWLRDIGAPKPFGDPTPIQRDYLWDEFLSETPVRPLASVHVQTDGALPDPVAETRFVAETAGSHRVAIVGLADLCAPDLATTLARHAETPGLVGLRQIVSHLPEAPGLSFAPRPLLSDATWRAGLARVAEAGLTFDLQCYPEQMHEAAEVISAHPQMPVILDHAGSPRNGADDTWRAGVAELAKLRQVSVKLSGWGMFDADWSAGTIAPMVDHLLGVFGPERVMFGSNYPVEKLAKPYDSVLRETARALALSGAGTALPQVFRDTAARVYRLDHPSA
ncbi:amidohydrolase family protein [Rhodobacterales bacterium HKCCSP123]|nr:amidohydrolase family protein [Rhodobacterales bacterium HKCCSP123]